MSTPNLNIQNQNPQQIRPTMDYHHYQKAAQPVQEQPKEKENSDKTKVAGVVLATALAAAALGGAVVHKRYKGSASELNRLRNAGRENESRIRDLVARNEALERETRYAREQFDQIFVEGLTPEEMQLRLRDELKTQVETKELNYKPMEPPIVNRGGTVEYEDAFDLPPRVPTTNRSHLRKYDIPDINADGSFEYQMPVTSEVKINKMPRVSFTPGKDIPTTLGESYADSVNWSNDKVVRDILQNFFDGHGHTLDGVRLKFTPVGGGRYKIRIEGDSTYTVDKAIILGETTKREDELAAGNYGEGLKVTVLKLLKSKGAHEVHLGSDDWKLAYKIAEGNVAKTRVLAYDLEKTTTPYNGNYLEFETDDRDLLETFRKGIDLFYHSGNTDFRCPDFENSLMGIKLLKPRELQVGPRGWNPVKGENGGIYIAGQRFEFDGDFRGLEGATIFLKKKPPKDVLDPSRDRTSLNTSDLRNIIRWVYDNMSTEEKLKFVNAMEPLWKRKSYQEEMAIDEMFDSFLTKNRYDSLNQLHINFPKDKYVAYSLASNDVVSDLMSRGYIICQERMSSMGMQTIKELLGEARAHIPVEPTKNDLQRINIIKQALKILSPGLEGKEFTAAELDTKIYLFDRTAAEEVRMNGDTLGEAIIDFDKSEGFWIDKAHLRDSKFGDILETALHELSHKVGGDESSIFSYKLTDVNGRVLEQLSGDPVARTKLKILNEMWNDLGKAS